MPARTLFVEEAFGARIWLPWKRDRTRRVPRCERALERNVALPEKVQLAFTLTLREEIVRPRRWKRMLTFPEHSAASVGREQYRGSVTPGEHVIGMHPPATDVGDWLGAQSLVGRTIRPLVVKV